ncbi:MAG: SLBB domain-containing protein [Thermoanaerobaculia bacterium]
MSARNLGLLGIGLLVSAALRGAPERPGDYPIGPKDLLEIRVLELPELNVERRVSDAGTIDLPLLGEFSVTGLTAGEARDRLETLLKSKYVRRASVSMTIREYANKPVSILGAVKVPGSLRVSGQWTLIQAISAAGGLSESAGKKIFVLRGGSGGKAETIEVGRDELFRGASDRWNIPLFPGDVVNIPARTTVTAYCLGEVKQPGAVQFDSDDGLTLLAAIARAGGLTDRASSTIRIRRKGPDGRDVGTVVNFKRVLSGKDPDPQLAQDDVIIVRESFF